MKLMKISFILGFLLIYSPQVQSFSWSETEAGYFPQGFSCMNRDEKANFKYFLSHSYSGRPYDSYRSEIEKNIAIRSQKFYDQNLSKEEWLCPSQALSIRSNHELEREKNRRGDFRRKDIIHSVNFSQRGLIMGQIAGEWGVTINGGSYNNRSFNLNYTDGRLEGDLQTGKITVRPLVLTPRHRFIIISLFEDQHVICYPKSMHKECNPFKAAPSEQLVPEKVFSWPETSAEENVQQ